MALNRAHPEGQAQGRARGWTGRKLLLRLFFLLALAGMAPSSQAFLQFDVFLGYGDVVPEAGWFPVICEIKNDGPEFNAVIEISAAQFNQSQTRQVPVQLPTNTKKRIVIPVFSVSRYGAWNFRLLDEKGKSRQEQLNLRPKKQIAAGTPLLVALSRSVAGVPPFPQIKTSQPDFQPTAARMLPALFPDNPIALDGVAAIYLNSSSALELNVPQVNALRAWLQNGGHLVVGVEQISDVSGNPWLSALVPCEFTSVSSIKPGDDLEKWVRVKPTARFYESGMQRRNRSGPPRGGSRVDPSPETEADAAFDRADLPVAVATLRDGHTVVSAQGLPLVIESARGRGRISVLTFSPERDPFLSWKNRPWFWSKIVGIPSETFETYDFRQYGWSVDGVFGAMIDSKQVRKLPLGWLLLLLVLYLLVIGPFDRYWLKKINRQMLTWVTFPVYVAVFSGLIYFIGYKLRAGETEYNEIHLVDVLPNGPQAVLRGHTYASIYSPANNRYSIVGEQMFASLRGEYLANRGGEDSTRATIVQRGNNFTAEVFVPVWTSQLFVTDWLQLGPAPLTMEVRGSGAGLTLNIENKLDRPVSAVHLVCNGYVYTVGDLAPGEKRSFVPADKPGIPLRDFVRNHGSMFFAAVEQRQSSFGGARANVFPDMASSVMAASFITLLNNNEAGNYRAFLSAPEVDLTSVAEKETALLLAWDGNHSLTPPQNKFAARRSHRDTLLRLAVPLEAPPR